MWNFPRQTAPWPGKIWRKTAWQGKFTPGTFARCAKRYAASGFSLVVANPPYFRAGSGGEGGAARTESATLADWCAAAGRLTKNGGRFALVHRPERLAELFAALRGGGLEPKRLQLIQHDAYTPPSAVLVEGVRQGGPGLKVLPVRLINRR